MNWKECRWERSTQTATVIILMLIESLMGTRINNMNLIINNKLIYIRKLMLKKPMIK